MLCRAWKKWAEHLPGLPLPKANCVEKSRGYVYGGGDDIRRTPAKITVVTILPFKKKSRKILRFFRFFSYCPEIIRRRFLSKMKSGVFP